MKNLKFRTLKIFLLLIMVVGMVSCDKFLDEKPNKNQVIANSIRDAQALLDYHPTMNQLDLGSGSVSADEYYITEARYLALAENFRRMYTWQNDYVFAPSYNDWTNLYNNLHIANAALETLEKVERVVSNSAQWDNVKGQALYYRAHLLLQGVAIWCEPYDGNTATNKDGLALRLNTNFNEKTTRATLEETYSQIVADLKEAIALLQTEQIAVTRPAKAAALGLLARTNLYMGNYKDAYANAALAIHLKGELMDFNDLDATSVYPIKQLNVEVLFESRIATPAPISNANIFISKDVYDSYTINDLRKSVLFRINTNGTIGFKGSYEGSNIYFSGLATDEVYLIAAESAGKIGALQEGTEYLNRLLIKRWKKDPITLKSTYEPLTFTSAQQLVAKVLLEREKELKLRGLRWMDIKRLNLAGANISIKRVIGSSEYVLLPGDKRFLLPIPEDVISISGIKQNPR